MKKSDIDAFFANESELDRDHYTLFKYSFESVIEPRLAAASLCQELSTAQWKRIGVAEDFRHRFGAKVVSLTDKGVIDTSPYSLLAQKYPKARACMVKIAYPIENFGPRIPNLLTAACGEGAFYSPGIATIKLLDIDFPQSFLQDFEGPQFGIEGVRDILEIYDRPIFLGVVKPNLGLSPKQFAELAYQSWLGGLDVAKDDELLSNLPWSPLKERAELLGKARLESERITGDKKMYLANITDEIDSVLELHDIAVSGGANALMINTMTTGFSAARALRKHATVPLVGHFAFIAPFTAIPNFGLHSKVITKLQRLIGLDIIIMPGYDERMKMSEPEVMENVQECFNPLGHLKRSLPVPAGSNWAGSLPFLYQKLGTVDFGIVPGRAVFGHPLGPRAGAASLRQGWEAVKKGLTIYEFARNHIELEAAIQAREGQAIVP